MRNALLLVIIVAFIGCQADDTPTTKTTETTPASDAPASVTISDLNLNSFAPYSKGPNGPIRLGILFELDAKTEADVDISGEYKKITTALDQMFTDDFGLFTVPPFSDYRNKFSISFATILSSEDQSYNPISDTQMAAMAAYVEKNKLLLQNAPNATEIEKIYEESFQQAGINPDNIDQIFFYLDPLGLSVPYDDVASIPETAITSTHPKDYTQAEKDWIIKRNLQRVEALFETRPFTVRVLISNNIDNGYAFTPRDESNTPTVFMGYSVPFLEPAFPQTLARTFVHEMGHITGQFEDEYYPFETDTNLEKGISCNCVSEEVALHNDIPFTTPSDIKTNPWLQEKLPYQNTNYQLEYDRITGPVPNYNGQLYEGCAGGRYKSYRTHNLSIMAYHYLFMDPATFAQGYGPVHRYYMENLFFKNY